MPLAIAQSIQSLHLRGGGAGISHFDQCKSMAGNADAALERLAAEEKMDVTDQLQNARLTYFRAMDSTEDIADLNRAKFSCKNLIFLALCVKKKKYVAFTRFSDW